MTNDSKQFIKKFWLRISILTLIVIALQFALFFILENDTPGRKDIIATVFIFLISGAGVSLFVYFREKYVDNAGFIFGGISLFKMMISVVFLLPVLLKKQEQEIFYVIEFFVIYMIFLIMEISVLTNFMKKLN